ncbi:histidine phosphatase family protein [Roseimicrobium sp. ORNL1]|uniref:histidine phosphatase family protein n=1 Tax=Roseimicrobium sp. ORNL1 TaxID=2711231 RepID=UPI0013E1A728|nr:histidine phosphatase family protein [Roseimicrobium sp. ORNL1]QIF03390.1 histidine phosphatase family protein [Roseimicrobium sp. ORNL1]
MKLILVRHGETEWNVQGREMGQLDSPLTARGLQQAEALAARLSSCRLHSLYCSDLGRALHTATLIAASCGVESIKDVALRERHMGILQGLTPTEMASQHPEVYAEYRRSPHTYEIPEGESGQQRQDRSVKALTEIAQRHPSLTVAVVTHGGFLMGFFEHVLGMTPGNGWRFKKQNAAYNCFEFTNDRWSLVTWNDTSHLDALGSLDDAAAGSST